MQKSIKSLKRNGILLLAYDLLVLCIVFVKNGMINIWSYWCGEIVLLLLVVALENMNQLVATSAILGMMAVYLIIGIWWVSRKL